MTGLNYVDVLSARDGERLPGFPFTFGWTTILADPVLYDVDEDGFEEIVVSTMGGEILFISRYGEIVPGRTFKIPRARVPKKWYAGLDDKTTTVYMSLADATRYEKQVLKSSDQDLFLGRKVAPLSEKVTIDADGVARKTYKGTTRKVDLKSQSANDLRSPTINTVRESSGKDAWKGFEGWLTDEGLDSLQLFLASRPLTETEEMDALFSPQYAHWMQSHPDHHQFPDSDTIFVDAHIYDAPIFADIDGDGWKELIVAVNYYFDDSITSKPKRVAKYPIDTDFTKYVTCGIVAFSMKREQIMWISPLELTTDASNFQARIYSSPTVVDLDNDGKLDIIVGTSVGSVYVLGGEEGLWNPRLARSINMDVIGAPIVAADITGDGKMNLLVADDAGTVVCFDVDGTAVWETRISSSVNHAPILGDVDGDGTLDVVISAVVGHVWALSGVDGKPLKGFPVKFPSVLNSAPLLVPFPPFRSKRPWHSATDGLTIVAHTVDGIIHNIHAKTGCVENVDLGEPSMGLILADDLTSNGFIDLLITTTVGHVFCMATGAPLGTSAAAWRSRRDGRNAFAIGVWQGVRLAEDTKQRHHVSGNTFYFTFEIVDLRPARGPNHHYSVKLWHGTRLWYSSTVYARGVHTASIPTPPEIMSASLTLEVVNEHGQAFFDTWNVGFNQSWYRTLKWLVALPVIFMSLALMFVKDVVHFLP